MIALGCDHGGLEIKNAIAADLRARGVEYKDVGTFAEDVGGLSGLREGRLRRNHVGTRRVRNPLLRHGHRHEHRRQQAARHPRGRAVGSAFSAEMTRRHNDANVLCLGGRVIDAAKAVELARIFLATPFEGGRHAKRVAMLEE